jgi:hypothetical protein
MNEIIFLVEPDSEGGYTAQALGHSIFTEADTWDELVLAVQDAVRCHFEEDERPAMVRLHDSSPFAAAHRYVERYSQGRSPAPGA